MINKISGLIPLKQWICDNCGELIENPDRGWLEWYTSGSILDKRGFRIVHDHDRCMYDSHELFKDGKSNSDMHLVDFLGPDGLVKLTNLLEKETSESIAEIVEIIKRLHVPFYEEGRIYLPLAWGDEKHHIDPYQIGDLSQSDLEELLRAYRKD